MRVSIISLLFLISGCGLFHQDCSKIDNAPERRQCQAEQGNKQAQFEMGMAAYKTKDYKMAREWWEKAAAPVSGRTSVYIPPVGNQKYGSVQTFDKGPTPGHKMAELMLGIMDAVNAKYIIIDGQNKQISPDNNPQNSSSRKE